MGEEVPAADQRNDFVCGGQGTTRLLVCEIPHFRRIIISSFSCDQPTCLDRNTQVQFGGEISPQGVRIELRVKSGECMDRQVVKGDHCTITIPEVGLEMPPETQRAKLTTVEGLLTVTADDLDANQPLRRALNPPVAEQIGGVIGKIRELLKRESEFTVILDDPSGNSHVENPHFPAVSHGSFLWSQLGEQDDPCMTLSTYQRTLQQDVDLGNVGEEEEGEEDAPAEPGNFPRTAEEERDVNEGHFPEAAAEPEEGTSVAVKEREVMRMPEMCGEVRMLQIRVPNFEDVIMMCFSCDNCGYKSAEAKASGGIKPKGLKLTLHARTPEDLNRNVLRSHTTTVSIPESVEGAAESSVTTVEGLVVMIKERLSKNSQILFSQGDSGESQDRRRLVRFFKQLDECKEGKAPFTLVLDDPLGNCCVEKLPDEAGDDDRLEREEYFRSRAQDDEFGLLDMRV